MSEPFAGLDQVVSWQALLGYLNFSEGRSDPRFQKQLNEAYAYLAEHGAERPWQTLHDLLTARLDALHAGGAAAFRDVHQAQAVLRLAYTGVLPAYRQHHHDLLAHLSDAERFQPYFLVRVFEAVLGQGGPWDEDERIVAGALKRLNDYVGHRPVAILETRPKGEPYDHERVRPIPLYIRGAGVAWGRYRALIQQALDILQAASDAIRGEASFALELLDELALDPRAYDHGHPVNRRPNYIFGEWDPHHIDNQGRFRRFVLRQVTLDALLERVTAAGGSPEGTSARPEAASHEELLFEAAAVLAGTILMAAGISGSGPTAHDSSVTLATLMPQIARYRDAFYRDLLEKRSGPHGDRLRNEASATRQPFGGARQHLNQCLARCRAEQMQQRHLALVFAAMGFPAASRAEAARIPVASVRMLSEILSRIKTGELLAEKGELTGARILGEVEDLLRRGIACGALADPWNVLGFQGLFPLYQSREDSVRDSRIDELVHVVEHIFDLYARLMSEAAAVGQQELIDQMKPGLRRLAGWWDRFATSTVGDVRRLSGAEALASAEHVSTALARWRERGEASADLTFWREHLDSFQTPKAFALVVDALLRKQDFKASMALLMNWLGQAEQVSLDEGEHSFHALALRWMLGMVQTDPVSGARQPAENSPPRGADVPRSPGVPGLVEKFIDFLEANAEDYWQVPTLEVEQLPMPREVEDNPYEAAYEDVTYQDSTDDDNEGEVLGDAAPTDEFYLEQLSDQLLKRLRFLATVARLWPLAARSCPDSPRLNQWLTTARHNREKLLALIDALHAYPVPQGVGTYESLIEYDRRRMLKEQLLYATINTCLETSLAVIALQGFRDADVSAETDSWQPLAVRLEQALLRGDVELARATLKPFLQIFRSEPLLYKALADGGEPRHILRVRTAQTVLRALVANLPRLGLLRETFHLLKTARAMEQALAITGRGMTEFNHVFQSGFQAVIETVIDSAADWDAEDGSDRRVANLLEVLTGPFLRLWVEHSRSLQIATLETLRGPEEWQALVKFIQRYGRDLFQARFLTLANLRGILHRGVGDYLDYLQANPDPLHPIRLLNELDSKISRADAIRLLTVGLQALVENYEEYKDYNTTSTQSDYGDNLHMLLAFLRLKASYDRHAWQFRPLVLVHEALARHQRSGAAILWQAAFTQLTQEFAQQHVKELAQLEQQYGMRLRTVADRLEERFVKPLQLDRLCALIGPAMDEAPKDGPGPAFARLREELQAYTATPVGVGLDVPHWLRRLEMEVQRVRSEHTAIAEMAEKQFQIPRVRLTSEDVRRQIADWDDQGPPRQ